MFLEYGGPTKLFCAFPLVTVIEHKMTCVNFVS
jgi:hypothetical protein